MPARLFAIAAAVVALHSSMPAARAADVPLTGDTTAAAEVWTTFDHWLAAYASGDLPGVMAIFAPDVVFEFQGSPDESFADLQRDYIADLKSRAPGTRWVPRVEEVHAEGSMAIVRSVWELHVGERVTQRNRSMDVFHRQGSDWRILRSINYPEPAPTRK
jgi:ketosteroid isomerase-like protein